MKNNEDAQKSMNDLGGKWFGKINTDDKESEIQVNFTTGRINSASIRLPGNDRKFISLSNADYNPPKIHFEYADGNDRCVFDGTLSNNRITGKFNHNGESDNFELTKVTNEGEDKNQHYYSDLNYPQ
jgi:hypothetical protein